MLIGKLLTHELTIKQRGEEQEEKKEKNKRIILKASQNDSEEESLKDFSDEDSEIVILTRNFKMFLRKQHTSRIRDFNKKYEGDGKKKTKEVTYYEYKKVSVLSSNSRIREQRIERTPLKLLGMTPLNQKRKRSKKKWPTFTLWLLKMKIRYNIFLTLLMMIIMMTMMMMIIMMMMMMRALL